MSKTTRFPFALATAVEDREVSASTANAIDAHLMEIASVKNHAAGDYEGGTVLAVVTFPKDAKSSLACDGEPWQDVRFRMSYDKLTDLGSKKIQDMLTPKTQARFRRRLGLDLLPPGVEYVVDFTPPSEGPELADLTAALWLPRMVKLWFLAGQYQPDRILENGVGVLSRPLADKAVGPILALGHDDVCKGLGCLSGYSEWQTKEGIPGIVEDNPADPSHIPSWRKVEDYCPIRHRVAIIRVLRAINGESLLLNSAVRLWTVAQVAISLEVPQVVVDPVTQWLVAPPNTKFIEICPERAFQLAYALKIPSVLVAAFKILVNELAIDYASSYPVTRRPQLTWAQRRRDDYGDYPSDPVEYASRAFAERMGETLKMLQSNDVFARLPARIPEWDKLQTYRAIIGTIAPGTPLRSAYEDLTAALLFVFDGWIDRALDLDSFNYNGLRNRRDALLEAQRHHYIPADKCKPLLNLYWALNPTQKLLTPFFWDRLEWLPTRAEFSATLHLGKSLQQRADTFNTELSAALRAATTAVNAAATDIALAVAACEATNQEHVISLLAIFDLGSFYHALRRALHLLCGKHLPSMTARGEEAGSNGIPMFLSDHLLLTLDEKELNYLPIWADGLDDGSGGVFQEVIPPAEMGPSEPGPGYHTGYTVGTGTVTETETDGGAGTVTGYGGGVSTVAPSDLGVGDLRGGHRGGGDRIAEWVSATGTSTTGGRSLHVQQSGASAATASSFTEGRSGATPSESFTAGGMEEEGMYADARYAQPAAHQAQGQAIERYVDEAEEEAGEGTAAAGEMEWQSDEEMEFELGDDDGSSTLDGFEEVDMEEAP
ncbi:hypothetical protein C8A01DRAFT_43719 [Parachaetomium inaequale]|uniref:Uncharacterized protein n=1 Tax=Parachaetomium inaequale TaxID=2588326 RepID=A0AAN6PNP7_9PEZI|nr:hypothetical protein C8A01DRAFT_43719 [Parachaetomium inaequale]